jgi:RimJ/RimL family protein N-acetyltransferase
MDMPILETERLRLRGFTMADLDRIAELYGNPQVMQFLGDGTPMSHEAAQERLTAMIYRWETRRIPIWAVELKDTGEWIGRCGLSPYKNTDDIELTYTLLPSFWGKGYTTEAANVCLGHVRDHCDWPGVIARTRPDNMRSRRVMEKLGFRFDRFEPDHVDGPHVFYVLTREMLGERHRQAPGWRLAST